MIPTSLPPLLPPLAPAPASAPLTPPSLGSNPASGASASFADELKGALRSMEQLQSNASQQVSSMVSGQGGDVHAGMIAVEKADLAFSMMLQLRNKAVSAYQDISHMSF
ncbi:MAG TPA: flagellar hook-basal body complex protein FliE [Terriglobales bacterium]|nr:flagellar hook-basal body complex protein FliE [Terriglobales bacterium]